MTMYFYLLIFLFVIMAAFFLIIGLRVILTKRPFSMPNKWMFWMLCLVFMPIILQPLYFPASNTDYMLWLNSAIFAVSLVMSYFALKGYVVYGVVDTTFREALLSSLDKLNLPYEETLSTVRLTSIEVDLQVSVQSWMGIGQLKSKKHMYSPQLTEIVSNMNEHFQITSASINLTTCIFFVIMGVLMLIGGIGMMFFF